MREVSESADADGSIETYMCAIRCLMHDCMASRDYASVLLPWCNCRWVRTQVRRPCKLLLQKHSLHSHVHCECNCTMMPLQVAAYTSEKAVQAAAAEATAGLLAAGSPWGVPGKQTFRVGQNRIYTLYMTVCMVISLPKIPYVHCI